MATAASPSCCPAPPARVIGYRSGSTAASRWSLRLYDTPVSATAAAIDPALLPRIEREGCQ